MWGKTQEIDRAHKLLSFGGRPKNQPGNSDTSQNRLGVKFVDYFKGLRSLFIYAGVAAEQQQKILIRATLSAGIGFVLALLTGRLFFFGIGLAVIVVDYLDLKRKIIKRSRSFESDYTALLLALASAVRTGQDPLTALCSSYQLFHENSLVRHEIIKFNHKIEEGASEEAALSYFASSINHPDISLFRIAFILARREGASLSQCLQRLAKVTRQRQSFRRKIQSSVAMQKMSAFGLGICAILMLLVQFTANPKSVTNAWAHPVGFKVLMLGGSLILLGIYLLRNMAAKEK